MMENYFDTMLNDILQEFTSGINIIIADIKVSNIALEKYGEYAVVMEKDSVGIKLKNVIGNLKNRIKGWFQSIINYMSSLFSNGEDFVKKHKNEILKKINTVNMRDLEFDGYYLKKTEPLFNRFSEESQKLITKIKNQANTVNSSINTTNRDRILEANNKLIGEIQEFEEKYKLEDFLGEKRTIKFYEWYSVEESMESILLYKEFIAVYDAAMKECDNILERFEKAVGNIRQTEDDDNDKTQYINDLSSFIKDVVNALTRIVGLNKKVVQTGYEQDVVFIKKVYNYRPNSPKKESVSILNENCIDYYINIVNGL